MGLFPAKIEQALVALVGGPYGNVIVLDPTNGNDSNPGTSFELPVKTLAAAWALVTTGQNDVIVYVPGTSSISLSAAFDWSKSYTHFVGLASPVPVASRARIFATAGDLGISPLFTVSGSGCIFKNLYWFFGVDDAHALLNVKVTGSRNAFENCHFAGAGHATNAIDGAASLYIDGGSENLFDKCTIGVDTIDAATGVMGLVFANTTEAARNQFTNCRFTMRAGHNASGFIELLGTSGIGAYTIFENCEFINLSTTTMQTGFVIPAGVDVRWKKFLLKDCTLIGATDWDKDDRGLLYLNNGTLTGGGNAGLFVVSAAA